MAELVVIGYPDVDTANSALDTVHAPESDLILQTGTAALVMFVSKATPDKTLAALSPLGGKLLRTWLSDDAEKELQLALDAKQG